MKEGFCHGPLPAEDATSATCWAEEEAEGIANTIELNPLMYVCVS